MAKKNVNVKAKKLETKRLARAAKKKIAPTAADIKKLEHKIYVEAISKQDNRKDGRCNTGTMDMVDGFAEVKLNIFVPILIMAASPNEAEETYQKIIDGFTEIAEAENIGDSFLFESRLWPDDEDPAYRTSLMFRATTLEQIENIRQSFTRKFFYEEFLGIGWELMLINKIKVELHKDLRKLPEWKSIENTINKNFQEIVEESKYLWDMLPEPGDGPKQ